MAAAPLETSSTPPGTTSRERPSLPGELMEDSEAQSTRKRPRLDSGSGIHESLSRRGSPIRELAEPVTTGPDTDEQQQVSSPDRPASRITINMKSPVDSVMTTESAVDAPGELPAEPPREPSSDAGAGVSSAISVSSSPAQSPEIQVAEVEDMDRAPGTTKWKSLEDAIRDQATSEAILLQDRQPLVEMFPRLRGSANLHTNIHEIGGMLEKGSTQDHAVLESLKAWFQEVSARLEELDYRAVEENRGFWDRVPVVAESLLRRSEEIEPPEVEDLFGCVETFFLSYARLALHLVQLDVVKLTRLAGEPETSLPDLMSRNYMASLGWLMQISVVPFYRTLQSIDSKQLADLVSRLNDQIASPPIDAVQHLAALASSAAPLVSRWPQLSQTLLQILTIAHTMAESGLERRKFRADDSLITSTALVRTLREVYSLCRCVDQTYQANIAKKASWITSETSEALIRVLSLIYFSLAQQNEQFAKQIAADLSTNVSEAISLQDYPIVIHWGWKFGVLKKHIMDGRMELRVHGVENMQNDLVHVWRQYIQGNPAGVKHPVVQYLVQFLRDNKIVEYLVGVDSHPQLISRSGNIVGFLVVTSTYTDLDTDTLWRTVTESQDPRTVSEILGMIGRTFPMHQSSSPALLHLCSKLLELPLPKFDAHMIDFCEQLFQQIRDKFVERSRLEPLDVLYIDAVPLRLCVRLIRESAADHDLSVEHKTILQKFASSQLVHFMRAGLSESDKLEMYEVCIRDIAEMNQFTVGSIQALNAMLPVYDVQAIRKLASDFDLTRLIVLETAKTVESGQVDFNDSFCRNAFLSRIQMLNRLLDKVPDTVSPELADVLWTEVFMSRKLRGQGKTAVWEMLSNVARVATKRNPFIERCLEQYLGQILPEHYSQEILAFAKQSITYEVRFNPPPIAGEDEVITVPGLERIWKLILTAPPGSIETEAMNYAIEVYLDHPLVQRSTRSAAEATHIKLVDRCVEQLKSAAAKLKSFSEGSTDGDDTPMTVAPDDGEIRSEELRFSRSLVFLRQLLQGLRSRPQYSPPRQPPPNLPDRPQKGDVIEISYQAFNEGSQTQVQSLRIGDLATAGELIEQLAQLAGFAKFDVIYGGQKLDLLEQPDKTLRDLKIRAGLMILRKNANGKGHSANDRRPSLTVVDTEVLKHFDDLYDLLNLEEDQLAREIFEFLMVFPPQERVRQLVKAPDSTDQDLFPMRKPYRFLYSINVLSACLREEALETYPDQEFVSHGIQVLVAALTRPEIMEALPGHPVRLTLACALVESLILAISVRSPCAERPSIVSDPGTLVQQLLNAISIARQLAAAQRSEGNAKKLICSSFAVLLKGSIRDIEFWTAVKQKTRFEQLLGTLLLEDSDAQVRKEVAETIIMVCGPQTSAKKAWKLADGDTSKPPDAKDPERVEILATIWEAFVQTLPQTPDHAPRSQAYFQAALAMFRSVAEQSPEDLIFGEYLRKWSDIMLTHKSDEFIGRELVDHLLLGFARLLRSCLELADRANTPLDTFNLAESLFNKYLFPDLSLPADGPISPEKPVMHTGTRHELYNVLALLCNRDRDYATVVGLLSDVVPQGLSDMPLLEVTRLLLLRLANGSADFTYTPNWCFEREKLIRSPVGYAGLRNLSNTCYLNSLFTQLFMNVEFRDFMIRLQIDEPQSQKLLEETKKVLGYMQETWRRSVDPQGLVETIRTYDDESIDVHIQMDVDEFYNLLFDRWEGQILDAEARKNFRAFYGGQLVQQIKSKECPHISERLEPFSAIQCEIKGKDTLEESLQAYVEGEIMQGDNKYSCTSCGRHVDAVKRACLKDVPDNLIFHLKRFDFDMVTMMRSKINDEFHFPDRIDMRPYKVDYLSDPNSDVPEDVFELVGVLVHSGNAESGHYYSYIRERPKADAAESWVEFNDSDVSAFEPSRLADQCFGGQNDGLNLGQVRFSKVWNAYMLFYQRVSSMERARSTYQPPSPGLPVRVPLPTELGNHIAMENEVFVRTYCLLDPYHASFVRCLLGRSAEMLKSEDRQVLKVGKSVIAVALTTVEQLVSRTKDLLELDAILDELIRLIDGNPKGALTILHWTTKKQDAIRNLLLRSPHVAVRNGFVRLVITAFSKLQNAQVDSTIEDAERKRWRTRFQELFESFVAHLEDLWAVLPNFGRSWDEYFELLVQLANFGATEVEILLDSRFLLRCLEMVWLDAEDPKRLRKQYATYYKLVEKGRKFSHKNLLELLATLLRSVDIALDPTPDYEPRVLRNGKFSLTETETPFVRGIGSNNELLFMKKVLQGQSNPAACRRIVRTLLNAEPEAELLEPLCKVLEEGLRIAPAALCQPFLDATLVVCARAPDEERIVRLVDFVAKGVESINNSGGREHLSFFTSVLGVHNDRIEKDEKWFSSLIIARIPDWAPTLLLYGERAVREMTFEALRRIIFIEQDDFPADLATVGQELARACIDRLQKQYLKVPDQNVDARTVDIILRVISHCLDTFFGESEDDQDFVQQAKVVIAAIEELSVEIPEELGSGELPSAQTTSASKSSDTRTCVDEWEDNSMMASDSDAGFAPSP